MIPLSWGVFVYEAENGSYLVFLLIASANFQAQVGTVERGYEDLWILHVQLFQNVFPGNFVGSSCQCHDGYVRKLFT